MSGDQNGGATHRSDELWLNPRLFDTAGAREAQGGAQFPEWENHLELLQKAGGVQGQAQELQNIQEGPGVDSGFLGEDGEANFLQQAALGVDGEAAVGDNIQCVDHSVLWQSEHGEFLDGDPAASTSLPEGAEAQGQDVPARPRLRWTPELHSLFLQAVNQLKSADNATPKAIMKLMNVEGLTIFHIKSHLQKYRANLRSSSSGRRAAANADSDYEDGPPRNSSRGRRRRSRTSRSRHDARQSKGEAPPRRGDAASPKADMPDEEGQSAGVSEGSAQQAPIHIPTHLDADRQAKLKQALLVQMEMQKQLHSQLETQRQLQLSLEAHGRYINSLIAPSISNEQTQRGDWGLSSTLPPVEAAVQDLGRIVSMQPLTLPALNSNAASSWDMARSSGTHLQLQSRRSGPLPSTSQSQVSPFESLGAVQPTSLAPGHGLELAANDLGLRRAASERGVIPHGSVPTSRMPEMNRFADWALGDRSRQLESWMQIDPAESGASLSDRDALAGGMQWSRELGASGGGCLQRGGSVGQRSLEELAAAWESARSQTLPPDKFLAAQHSPAPPRKVVSDPSAAPLPRVMPGSGVKSEGEPGQRKVPQRRCVRNEDEDWRP